MPKMLSPQCWHQAGEGSVDRAQPPGAFSAILHLAQQTINSYGWFEGDFFSTMSDTEPVEE